MSAILEWHLRSLCFYGHMLHLAGHSSRYARFSNCSQECWQVFSVKEWAWYLSSIGVWNSTRESWKLETLNLNWEFLVNIGRLVTGVPFGHFVIKLWVYWPSPPMWCWVKDRNHRWRDTLSWWPDWCIALSVFQVVALHYGWWRGVESRYVMCCGSEGRDWPSQLRRYGTRQTLRYNANGFEFTR